MKTNDVNSSLYWKFIQVMVRTKHRVMELAEPYGLTVMQVHTLGLLEPNHPQPMNVLSGLLGCDASNVTGIVDRLEDRELIQRQDNPKDRRVKMIALTDRGESLRQEVIKQLVQDEAKVLSALSSREQLELDRLLQTLLQQPPTV